MRITTRHLLISLVLLTLVGIGIGVSIVAAQKQKLEAQTCEPVTHRHRYADLKLALVEVTERDSCGFRFKDLERPVSDRVQLAKDFTVAEVAEARAVGETVSTILPRSSLHAGLRGVVSYCEVCRTVFSLKTWKEER